MDKDSIKKLKDDPYFKNFQSHILIKIDQLKNIHDLQEMTNKNAGETVKVRALVSEKLIEIFSPFLDFREKIEPTVEEIQAVKKRAGM